MRMNNRLKLSVKLSDITSKLARKLQHIVLLVAVLLRPLDGNAATS